jgi:purine-binding chemotaxis protein CheW
MGRMSEARKKARQKAAAPAADGGKGLPRNEARGAAGDFAPLPPAEGEAPGPGPDEAAPGPAALEESWVFPADGTGEEAGASPGERLALPSSGLAEDILSALPARPAPVEAAVPTEAVPAPAAPAEAAPGRGHSISFFSAPAREERAAAEETEHLATFFLDREEYGVDVRLVQEIRRVTEITQVPRAPDFIKGVINLRGRIIPVIDLKRKLGLGEVEVTKRSRIVVVTIKGRLLGLLVDGASQVKKIPVSSVEPAPEEVVQKGGDYLRGVAKLEGRLIILIELPTVLAVELSEGGAA